MKYLLIVFFVFISFSKIHAQSNPVAIRPDITINPVIGAADFSSGIAYDPVSQSLFYTTLGGDIHKVNYPGTGPITDSVLYTTVDHGIILLKGLMFQDSTLFLIGDNDIDTAFTTGVIKRGVLQSNGTRNWTTVMQTDSHQLGKTFFDHGYSGLCLNPAKDSIFFNSGSRTDHGEIQDNNGIFPGLRETPLTSAVFSIPVNSANLILPNDSSLLAPYLFADGIRNCFSMAFDPLGHLIGCENSGDRDDPEELNFIDRNNHYGFPWIMGGNANPQQFPGYDPLTDLLLNQGRSSVQQGFFHDDPTFPQLSPSLTITAGIPNSGPHADKYRDTISGNILDASDLGITMGSVTAHKSVLGLVFDYDSLLINDLKGHGFMFGNQKGGDSLGNAPGGGFGTLADPGEDMLDVDLVYNTVSGTYIMETDRIAQGFTRPVSACMVGTSIFLLEYGRPSAPGSIYEIVMPPDPTGLADEPFNENMIEVYPNPVSDILNITVNNIAGKFLILKLFDVRGDLIQVINHDPIQVFPIQLKVDMSEFSPGTYFLILNGTEASATKVIKLQ